MALSTAARVGITLDEFGAGTLTVDGHDLSSSVSPEFTIQGRGGGLPAVLTIRIGRLALALDADAMDVELDEQTTAALAALGWTKS